MAGHSTAVAVVTRKRIAPANAKTILGEEHMPIWKSDVPMQRLIQWIKWTCRSPREAAFTIITVIFIAWMIMLLVAYQTPLRS